MVQWARFMYIRAMWALLDWARTRSIEVASYGWSDGTPHPHRPDPSFHDLLVILAGSWSVVTPEGDHHVEAGDVLLLPAHLLHTGNERCTRGTRWMYVHFPPAPRDRVVGVMPQGMPDDTISVPHLSRAAIDQHSESLVHAIVRGHWSSSHEERLGSRIALAGLLLALARRGAATTVADRMIASVIAHIESNPLASDSLDMLAESVNCSRRSLTRRFRIAMGQSVHSFRMGLRLRRARALLHDHPMMPLREVASATGFADEFHLGKAFHRQYGRPPGAARGQARS
jgi:AraC-like DNA-binding protein